MNHEAAAGRKMSASPAAENGIPLSHHPVRNNGAGRTNHGFEPELGSRGDLPQEDPRLETYFQNENSREVPKFRFGFLSFLASYSFQNLTDMFLTLGLVSGSFGRTRGPDS